ncbi:hypothetical protein [Nakamurella endophytica]|uniref:hypothetical protein n=1 Tax=Nakamurella endophytica TaxID=1748367 RepID=UPI00166498D4|nr:hypothetical protein [Nakamurella endophytica]
MERLARLRDSTQVSRTQPSVRQYVIKSWLAEADALATDERFGPDEAIELAVQRQGLLWDAATTYGQAEMSTLFGQLSDFRPLERVDRSSLSKREYFTLQSLQDDKDRALAVALRKGPRSWLSASRDAGERAVARWQNDPAILSTVGDLGWDLAQQDYLAHAGFYVTRLEEYLTARWPDRQPEPIIRVAARAQLWASAAVALFEQLGSNLPANRWDEQRRLAVPLWEINTRLLELRAFTGVLACLRTNLFTERAWRAQITHVDWSVTQGGIRHVTTGADLWLALVDGYLHLMQHPLVTARDYPRLRQQALGLMLVSRTGLLPVPPPIDIRAVRGPGAQSAYELQNDDSPLVAEVKRDPWLIVDALLRRNDKLGWVGKLHNKGPVWTHLVTAHDELLAALRRAR